jgi:phosphoglucomutase
MNLVMPGLDGITKMRDLMANLREKPPTELAGVKVIAQRDYQPGTILDVKTGQTSEMELSGSNVLRYDLEDNTAVIVRPSGTEPKVKVYILANGTTRAQCDEKISKYSKWAETLSG